MLKAVLKSHVGFSTKRTLCVCAVLLCFIQGISCDCTLVEDAATKSEQKLLKTIEPLRGMEFTAKDEDGDVKYNYSIRICDQVPGANKSVGAMQYSEKKNHSLGLYNMSDIMGGTDWLMLTYYNGSSHTNHCNGTERMTRLMIICDPDRVKGDFRILEEKLRSNTRYCFYLFELGSSVACTPRPATTSHGLSSGGVFCVLFFTFIGTYFILGFLYQRLVAGAKGLEQIPHYSFWRAFGNLQADGCDYICRCGPRQESQAYRGIDERLRTEEERDEQLLNM